MKENSKIIIVDTVLEKNDLSPVKKRTVDLIMMAMLTGQERSQYDFEQLLEKINMKIDSVTPTRTPYSVVQASIKK